MVVHVQRENPVLLIQSEDDVVEQESSWGEEGRKKAIQREDRSRENIVQEREKEGTVRDEVERSNIQRTSPKASASSTSHQAREKQDHHQQQAEAMRWGRGDESWGEEDSIRRRGKTMMMILRRQAWRCKNSGRGDVARMKRLLLEFLTVDAKCRCYRPTPKHLKNSLIPSPAPNDDIRSCQLGRLLVVFS